MMVGVIGALDAVDPSKLCWSTYVERTEHNYIANNVEDERKETAF